MRGFLWGLCVFGFFPSIYLFLNAPLLGLLVWAAMAGIIYWQED